MKRLCTPFRALQVESLEGRDVPSTLQITFDYRYDNGFFNDPARRTAMEQVGQELSSRLNANVDFAAITPALIIGALAEREGKHIEVYEPYLAGTHDEKMFRVVKDRAQWFDIVMGRAAGADESATDAEERRVPLHERIRAALAMDLRSPGQKN